MSFWGTLGKIGAGVAAPFTGGASLWAIPAISAAEGAKKGGWKGALKGGAIGGAEMFIPGVAGKVVGKIPGVGSAISKFIGGGMMPKGIGGGIMRGSSVSPAGGVLKNFVGPQTGTTISPVGATLRNVVGASGVPTAGTTISPAGGILRDVVGSTGSASGGKMAAVGSGLKKFFSDPQKMGDVGKVLGGFTEGEAKNRYEKGKLVQGYDRLMLDAAENRRADEIAGLRNLQFGQYISGGGRPYMAAPGLPTYGFGPQGTSMAERAGATTLMEQMLKRLQPGGSYTPTKPGYADRGQIERITNAAGAVLGGVGALGKVS